MNSPVQAKTVHEKVVNLRETPAVIKKITVDGVCRTKDDIIEKQLEGLFETENFYDLVHNIQVGKDKLRSLGIFKSVDVIIDTCKVPNSGRFGYEVRYFVEEQRFMSGGAHTQIGTNDGNLLFNIRIPNIFGRAEKMTVEYTYGTKQSRGIAVNVKKILDGNPDIVLGTSVFQAHGEYPWSGYKETDRGVSTDFSFPSIIGQHNIKWEAVWRDLRSLSNTTSFIVREQAGHSLKSCLKHTYERDGRDDTIFPKEGTLFRLSQEYAGIGGNAKFVKNDVEFQLNQPLFYDTVFQASMAGGLLNSLDPNQETLINDKFFLGGPLTLRGFNMKGVGPNSDGNALGGDMYCMGALHLYTPLPFKAGSGGLGDLFRSHFFVTAGNCGVLRNISRDQLNRENWDVFRNSLRLSYGCGLALRLGGVARVELNYVVPVWLSKGDSANPGLQLGVGISFL